MSHTRDAKHIMAINFYCTWLCPQLTGQLADKNSHLLGHSSGTFDGENPVIMEPSSDGMPQYSPSVSHDEKEEEEEKWAELEPAEKEEGEEFDDQKEDTLPSERFDGGSFPAASVHSNRANERDNEDSEDDWGGFEEGEGGSVLEQDAGGWGSAWTTESEHRTSSVASSQSQGEDTLITTPTTPTGSSKGKLKLSFKSKRTTVNPPSTGRRKEEMVINSSRNSLVSPKSSKSELGDKMKGRLKREDIERLEQQALLAAAEPDFFADMTPQIRGGSSTSSSISLLTSPKTAVAGKRTEPVLAEGSGSSLQYQLTPADQVR